MKRMTKLLSLVLAALMLVGMLPLGVWAADETHTVRFNLNYNGAPKLPDQKVADGEYAAQPEGVTRAGWHFAYWYVKLGDNKVETFDLATTPITKDVTLYARWTEDTLSRAEKMAQGIELAKRMEEKEEDYGDFKDEDDLIAWDENNLQNFYSSSAGGATIRLNVITSNENVRVSWSARQGRLSSNSGEETNWTLPSNVGSYTLTVVGYDTESSTKTTLTKTITVLSDEIIEAFESLKEDDSSLDGMPFDIDPEGDFDDDGITNQEEEELGTNMFSDDSDGDSISDSDEINKYKTDPLNPDTDGDGINDGYEIALGLNPLSPYSNGVDHDMDRVFSHSITSESSAFALDISGNAVVVVSAYMTLYNNEYISEINGVVSPVIDIYTDANCGTFNSATLTYTYTDAELGTSNADNLSFYYINETTKEFEKVETVIDTANHTATATLSHFSKYVLADLSLIVNDFGTADVMFVIDNSGSMSWNDPSDARLDAVKDLASSFDEKIKSALITFTGSAKKVIENFQNYDTNFESKINALYGTASGGTSISRALSLANTVFTESTPNKIIILFTDGEDYNVDGIKAAVKDAVAKNIRIYVIGLGDSVNSTMLSQDIAEPTNGKYYHIDDAKKIDYIFSGIKGMIDSYIEITVSSGEVLKGNIIADSGFNVQKHAFSFRNFRSMYSDNGACSGMVEVAKQVYYAALPFQSQNKWWHFSTKKHTYNVENVDGFKKGTLFNIDIDYDALWLYDLYNTKLEFYDQQDDGTWVFNDYVNDLIHFYGYTTGITTVGATDHDGESINIQIEYIKLIDTLDDAFKSSTYWNTEKAETLKCILWWYLDQYDQMYTSPGLAQEGLKLGNLELLKQFNKLKDLLGNGYPVHVGFAGKAGDHALLATKVLQSTTDPKEYYILIYDCNDPGKINYFSLELVTMFGRPACYKLKMPDKYASYKYAGISHYDQ